MQVLLTGLLIQRGADLVEDRLEAHVGICSSRGVARKIRRDVDVHQRLRGKRQCEVDILDDKKTQRQTGLRAQEWRRTERLAIDFHLDIPSETDSRIHCDCKPVFRCETSVRWSRKSAGDASSSVISSISPGSGRLEGGNMTGTRLPSCRDIQAGRTMYRDPVSRNVGKCHNAGV